jgi:hypothetical protein
MERNPPTNTSPFVRMLQHLTYCLEIPAPPDELQMDMICKLQQKPTSNAPRKSIDIYCDACGGHGHTWKRCNYLAKLAKSFEFLTKLDKAKTQEIIQVYHKEQERLRQ